VEFSVASCELSNVSPDLSIYTHAHEQHKT
jgi:hypothetical protein